MKYETIIFDLDGTILNTLPDLTASVNFALNYFNFPQRTKDEIRSFIGNGVALLFKRSLSDNTDEKICLECLRIFREHYKVNYAVKTVPYDYILETIRELKNCGVKIGVVSNKFDLAVKSLCDKFCTDLIDVAIGEIDGIPRKPAPDSLNKATTLYVGDSEVDINTAKNSGVDCVSVAWGFKDIDFLIDNGAKIIVESPIELLEFIKSL